MKGDKMKKEKKLRKLIWKYFWQRKLIELLILTLIIFIPYFLGRISWKRFNTTEYYVDIGNVFLCWFGGAVALITALLIAFSICMIIHSNWTKAKEKAEEKIKKLNKLK
jgi:NADH:ubiquinone oxidoreductase subunit 5 (subunit L)/multisubunit Na+/H+ antiporter MnhA subunit